MPTILINPLACPRPRISPKPFPHAYYSKAYDMWRKAACEALLPYAQAVTGAVEVDVSFYVERPRTTKLAGPKPDLDNYIKAFLDAGTKAGLWGDDAQVTTITARKTWAAPGSPGYINFTITPEAHREI